MDVWHIVMFTFKHLILNKCKVCVCSHVRVVCVYMLACVCVCVYFLQMYL